MEQLLKYFSLEAPNLLYHVLHHQLLLKKCGSKRLLFIAKAMDGQVSMATNGTLTLEMLQLRIQLGLYVF